MKSPLSILYEDNHVCIIDKPAGITTQADPNSIAHISAEQILNAYITQRDHKLHQTFLHPIFRLDKPVSGITVFAKSKKALCRLNAFQREGLYEKRYIALVVSHSRSCAQLTEGDILTDFLIHDEFKSRIAQVHERQKAKIAQLQIIRITSIHAPSYQVGTILEIELKLITGRYHQIRIQLSSRHWIIYGDIRYGFSLPLCSEVGSRITMTSAAAITLHHHRISFPYPVPHPQKPPELSLSSPIPWSLK